MLGPGPVTLDQGTSLQFTAARGCRRLRETGHRVVVLEDNPCTLMDLGGDEGDLYVEPPAPEVIEKVIEACGARSVWYGLAGRRGWTLALRLAGEGFYERLGISAPDIDDRALWACGDRSLLRESLEAWGIANPAFRAAASPREGQEAAEALGFPLVVRPHFSSGGWGAGVAYNQEEYPMLLEEALRESLTGEVLVEEALVGWRGYTAVVLRDASGDSYLPGVVEQLDPLPLHDEDAVTVYPALHAGREEIYALTEMAREAAVCLDLVGLVEVKLAAAPGWEALYVLDVNPRPSRSMPLLEAALGADLLDLHLGLAQGRPLPRELKGPRDAAGDAAMVAVPRPLCRREGGSEGVPSLGCRSVGKRVYLGSDMGAVISLALDELRHEEGREGDAAPGALLRSARRRAAAGGASRAGGAAGGYRIFRVADGAMGAGVMFLGGDGEGPGGGLEEEFNCHRAMSAWREAGNGAVIYTADAGSALLARGEAEAVWLGPMRAEEVARAAAAAGTEGLVPHFGGASAMSCAAALAGMGTRILCWKDMERCSSERLVLESLREAGLPVVDFDVSSGWDEGVASLRCGGFPKLASVTSGGKEILQRLIYAEEDGRDLLREYPGGEVLWRTVREEVHEIQVEAVAGLRGGDLVLLWEQVDEAGICSSDGLAVYPPRYVTSEQSARADGLAREVIGEMGWRGNLSMRIFLQNGDARVWDARLGPSPNLPFLSRASSLDLAACGMTAIGGRGAEQPVPATGRNAVRAPLIPFGLIAASDILPSPQRRSTGAVLGVAADPAVALAKAFWSEGLKPHPGGRAFLSVANREKRRAVFLARELQEMGYFLMATRGTANALTSADIEVERVHKLREGRPNILDHIRNGRVDLVINIPRGKFPHSDGFYIRAASARFGIPCVTDMEMAMALARGLRGADPHAWDVRPLRDHGRSRHGAKGG